MRSQIGRPHSRKQLPIVVACLLSLVGGAAVLVLTSDGGVKRKQPDSLQKSEQLAKKEELNRRVRHADKATDPKVTDTNVVKPAPRRKAVKVGDVSRPETYVTKKQHDFESKLESQSEFFKMVGSSQAVSIESSPAAASVAEAYETRENLGRVSLLIEAEPFDLEQYKSAPKEYLEVHEPGRVWQSAKPGPGVPVLQMLSREFHVLRQGEAARLAVRTLPEMPATFSSLDLGTFSNGLTSISVAADEQGKAEVTFYASSGTIGMVNILVSSPVAAEQQRFRVYVMRRPVDSPDQD